MLEGNPRAAKPFPPGFLWGAATAAYQVEGGIENNDWAAAARAGKVPPAGRACDHYNRFREDFDLARSLGHNAHRFSIEWARVEPREGEWSIEALTHYRLVLDELNARSLRPFVTLWHFTLPEWFARRGGFLHPQAPEIFARYCEKVVRELGRGVIHWTTINEPMVYASNAYLRGCWPPFHRNPLAFLRAVESLIQAHRLVYERIKTVAPQTQVGIAKNNIAFGANANPVNKLMAVLMDRFWNRWFLNATRERLDWIGLNHYFTRTFGRPDRGEKTDMGWPIAPEGIRRTLMALASYGKPLYVTENGLADTSDRLRPDYIKNYLSEVHRSIAAGADVRGYFHWSLLDNFEWAHGFIPRFGLIQMDYETFARRPRPSAKIYAEICRVNALSS